MRSFLPSSLCFSSCSLLLFPSSLVFGCGFRQSSTRSSDQLSAQLHSVQAALANAEKELTRAMQKNKVGKAEPPG